MNGVGQQLLAATAGTGDQDADVRPRHHARLLEHTLHVRTAGDDGGAPVVVAVAGGAWRLTQGILDGGKQFIAIHGLGQEAEHPLARGADRIGNRSVGGQDDDRQARREFLQLVEQRHAIHFIHAQVGEHQVRACPAQAIQCLAPTFGRGDPIATALQTHPQQLEQAGVVIHQ